MRIRLAPQARADLDGIWLYLARESGNIEIATRAIAAITEKFGLFARFPYLGKELRPGATPDVRTFPFNNYVIFYNPKAGEIRILRIIHASRDAAAVFADE
jgi:toxin ParE1/3/4